MPSCADKSLAVSATPQSAHPLGTVTADTMRWPTSPTKLAQEQERHHSRGFRRATSHRTLGDINLELAQRSSSSLHRDSAPSIFPTSPHVCLERRPCPWDDPDTDEWTTDLEPHSGMDDTEILALTTVPWPLLAWSPTPFSLSSTAPSPLALCRFLARDPVISLAGA